MVSFFFTHSRSVRSFLSNKYRCPDSDSVDGETFWCTRPAVRWQRVDVQMRRSDTKHYDPKPWDFWCMKEAVTQKIFPGGFSSWSVSYFRTVPISLKKEREKKKKIKNEKDSRTGIIARNNVVVVKPSGDPRKSSESWSGYNDGGVMGVVKTGGGGVSTLEVKEFRRSRLSR